VTRAEQLREPYGERFAVPESLLAMIDSGATLV
jgi:hypothetical protein